MQTVMANNKKMMPMLVEGTRVHEICADVLTAIEKKVQEGNNSLASEEFGDPNMKFIAFQLNWVVTLLKQHLKF